MVDLFELFERDGAKRNTGERRKGFRGLLDRVMNAVDAEGDDDGPETRERRDKDQGKYEERRRERESFFDD